MQGSEGQIIMEEASGQVHTDVNDVKGVLDCILSELKSIKSQLAQQNSESAVRGTIAPVLTSLTDTSVRQESFA